MTESRSELRGVGSNFYGNEASNLRAMGTNLMDLKLEEFRVTFLE